MNVSINSDVLYMPTRFLLFHHGHKKRKDSLEKRALLLILSPELKISGVAVQSIHQNSEKW